MCPQKRETSDFLGKKISFSKLNTDIEVKQLYKLLIDLAFDKLEISLIFNSHGLTIDDTVLVQPNVYKEIYSSLLFAKQRLDRLKVSRKLSFFKPAWFRTESEVAIVASTSRISSKSQGTFNDEINRLEYNNFFSEFTTWKEYQLAEKCIDELDLELERVSEQLFEAYANFCCGK